MFKKLLGILMAALLVLAVVPAASAVGAVRDGETPDLDAALNAEGGELHFVTGEDYPWIVLEEGDRVWAQSGNTGVDATTSYVSASVIAEVDDTVTFDYKAWGEGANTPWDRCEFLVDDEVILSKGKLDNDWTSYTYAFTEEGEHVLTWSFTKDGSDAGPGDYFAVDEIETTAEAVQEPIAIHEVWVTGWGTPVEGIAGIDNMFLETPEDAHYFIIYGGWRDETDQQQMWSEEHVFIAEHEYSEGAQIWADEGYYFAEDCVFHCEHDEILDPEWCYVDPDANYICYVNSIPVVCEHEPVWGDANGDWEVNFEDALLMMRHVMELQAIAPEYLDPWCDVNCDGVWDMTDALLIARYANDMIDSLPVID